MNPLITVAQTHRRLRLADLSKPDANEDGFKPIRDELRAWFAEVDDNTFIVNYHFVLSPGDEGHPGFEELLSTTAMAVNVLPEEVDVVLLARVGRPELPERHDRVRATPSTAMALTVRLKDDPMLDSAISEQTVGWTNDLPAYHMFDIIQLREPKAVFTLGKLLGFFDQRTSSAFSMYNSDCEPSSPLHRWRAG